MIFGTVQSEAMDKKEMQCCYRYSVDIAKVITK